MKKKLKTLLGIVLPTAVCAGAIFAFSAVAANKYDVTGDGKVNSHDLVNMMKYLSGEIKYDPDTTESDNTDVTSNIGTDIPEDSDGFEVPSVITESIPGVDLPFDVVGVGLATENDNDSTLIFDDAAKAAEYLGNRYFESGNLSDAVSEVDTAEKRIIIFNIEGPSWTHYYSNLRELEKLSLHEDKLAVLYVDREDPDIVVDCSEGYIVTIVTVDRDAAETLSATPDVELYMYRAASKVLEKY